MQPSNPSYLKSISILHLALLIGQLLMGAIFFVLVYFMNVKSDRMQALSQQMLIACMVAGAIAFIAGKFLFRKKLELINQGNISLAQKLNDYRAASIVRWALIEAATLFSIISFLMTNNYLIILVAGILLVVFATLRPTRQKIAADLNVSEGEIELNNEIGL